MPRPALGLAVLILALLADPSVGAVKAVYRDASPAAESTVVGAPRYVLITFTEEIKTISIVVRGPGGGVLTNGPAIVNPTDRTNVSVQIHDGGDGRYEVSWDLVSAFDLDTNGGGFGFWVGLTAAPGTAPAAAGQPAAARAPAPQPAPAVVSQPAPAAPVVPASPEMARDGRSLVGEPASTQALFRSLWGDRAAIQWAAEHNAELSRGL